MAEEAKTKASSGARKMGGVNLPASRIGYGAMELAGPPKARDLTEAEANAWAKKNASVWGL